MEQYFRTARKFRTIMGVPIALSQSSTHANDDKNLTSHKHADTYADSIDEENIAEVYKL